MYDMERITRLIAMVWVTLVWAYLVGEHMDINIKKIRILKHANRAKSIVGYGLEGDADILNRPWRKPDVDIFKSLSCS